MNLVKKLIGISLLFGLMVIGCDNGNGTKTYNVTIGTLTHANGSTISASPTSGTEGTEITLTVNVVNNYQLKAGTLKYNGTAVNETTKKFNLPASDVTITAEFESISENHFIGTWEYSVNNEVVSTYRFNNNLTGTITDKTDQGTSTVDMAYSYTENTLTLVAGTLTYEATYEFNSNFTSLTLTGLYKDDDGTPLAIVYVKAG
jgi:hypothetical protein